MRDPHPHHADVQGRVIDVPSPAQGAPSPALGEHRTPAPIATFAGWIPQIKSGILIGAGAQVKFDAGEDAIPELLKLIEYGRDRELVICVFEKTKTYGDPEKDPES